MFLKYNMVNILQAIQAIARAVRLWFKANMIIFVKDKSIKIFFIFAGKKMSLFWQIYMKLIENTKIAKDVLASNKVCVENSFTR